MAGTVTCQLTRVSVPFEEDEVLALCGALGVVPEPERDAIAWLIANLALAAPVVEATFEEDADEAEG